VKAKRVINQGKKKQQGWGSGRKKKIISRGEHDKNLQKEERGLNINNGKGGGKQVLCIERKLGYIPPGVERDRLYRLYPCKTGEESSRGNY